MARTGCARCDKREGCLIPEKDKAMRQLCWQMEKMLRATVDVKQKEQPMKTEYERLCPKKWPITPDTKKLIIRMFFFEKKTQTEIANILEVSQPYVSQIIKRYRSKVEKQA